MWAEFWEWLSGGEPPRKRLFVRTIVLSGPVRTFLEHCRHEDAFAFADLLLRLDADPFKHSENLSGLAPGMRWAGIPGYTVVFTFDPAKDLIRIASVRP